MEASAGESSRERILRVATDLFAAQGFDRVTTRDIAGAAGLNVATVHHHLGRKSDVYEAVLARLHERERAVLEDAAAHLDDDTLIQPSRLRPAVHAALDAYLDFLLGEPAAAALWVRRWLDAVTDPDEVWSRYALPLYRLMEERLAKAAAQGTVAPVDAHLLLRTIVWATHGYLTGGLPEEIDAPDRNALPGRDPHQLERFRRFLRQLVDRMLWPAQEDR